MEYTAENKNTIQVPTKSNFHQYYWVTPSLSGIKNGQLQIIPRPNDDDVNLEELLFADLEIYHYADGRRGNTVGDLRCLAAYALGEKGIFYAKEDTIWYWNTDGDLRKLGEQEWVIGLEDDGEGTLTVEYLEEVPSADDCSSEYLGDPDGPYCYTYELSIGKKTFSY